MSAVYGFDQGFEIYDDQGRMAIEQILPKVEKWLNKNKIKFHFFFSFIVLIFMILINHHLLMIAIFHDFTYTGKLIRDSRT